MSGHAIIGSYLYNKTIGSSRASAGERQSRNHLVARRPLREKDAEGHWEGTWVEESKEPLGQSDV